MASKDAPKAFTLRASEEDRAAIIALREYTRSATNSKAIWQAVREYVNRCEELADSMDRAERLRRENEALKAKIADWREATAALAVLESLAAKQED